MASLLPNATNSTGNSTTYFSHKVDIPSVIFLSILIPLICSGNLLVCIVFLKYQRLRTATNCFLFSLAISDLAVGVILIPFFIALVMKSFHVPRNLIITYTCTEVTCSVASMANLASVSIERWYGVTYPFRHMSVSLKKAACMAAFSWLYGFCISLLFLSLNIWLFDLINILGFLLPFIVIVICYCGIARQVRKKNTTGHVQSGRECKTIKTLLMITFVYLICWSPYIVGNIITNHCVNCTKFVEERPFLRTSPKLLHYFNSCLNPLLYALMCPSLKSAYKQLLFGVQLSRGPNQMGMYRHRLSQEPSNTNISVIRKSNVGFLDRNKLENGVYCHNNNRVSSPDRESTV